MSVRKVFCISKTVAFALRVWKLRKHRWLRGFVQAPNNVFRATGLNAKKDRTTYRNRLPPETQKKRENKQFCISKFPSNSIPTFPSDAFRCDMFRSLWLGPPERRRCGAVAKNGDQSCWQRFIVYRISPEQKPLEQIIKRFIHLFLLNKLQKPLELQKMDTQTERSSMKRKRYHGDERDWSSEKQKHPRSTHGVSHVERENATRHLPMI